eukprot:678982-Prymnesium_polylepis.3
MAALGQRLESGNVSSIPRAEYACAHRRREAEGKHQRCRKVLEEAYDHHVAIRLQPILPGARSPVGLAPIARGEEGGPAHGHGNDDDQRD